MNRASKKRLSQCNKCEHARKLFGKVTCGTPVIGNKIKYNGKEVELCGCVMELKVLLMDAACPLNKWNDSDTDKRKTIQRTYRLEGGDADAIY